MVYVDDFKVPGPCENMNKGRKLIRTSIKPTNHRRQANVWVVTTSLKRFRLMAGRFDKCFNDMEQFMVQRVEKYLTAANKPEILSNSQQLLSWTKVD